jgi:hypothetical protein
LGLFDLTRDAASKPPAGELGGAIDIGRFDIIDRNHSRESKSELITDGNASYIIFM